MIESEVFCDFLHNAHIFATMVQEVLEEKYLRQTTDLDLTASQFNLLRLITYNGDHQVRQIADFLGVSQAAASKNVDKLVRMGLVTRQAHETDRRSVSLGLTKGGRNLIEKYEALKAENLKKALQDVPPEELEVLSQGLQKISQVILKQEHDFGLICMKCNAYYAERCSLRPLSDGCIYTRNHGRAELESVDPTGERSVDAALAAEK